MLITQDLFFYVSDGTNGDGAGGKEAGECDVHGEGGLGFIVFSCRFERTGLDFFFW